MAYSFKLKHLVLLDIMTIAVGFMLRALGVGIVINVNFTPWFLLCVFLLSLLLATGKRRHELMLLKQNKGSHRKVLEHYSGGFFESNNWHLDDSDGYFVQHVHLLIRSNHLFDVHDSPCYVWHIQIPIFNSHQMKGGNQKNCCSRIRAS